jgi:hypothetical protein
VKTENWDGAVQSFRNAICLHQESRSTYTTGRLVMGDRVFAFIDLDRPRDRDAL